MEGLIISEFEDPRSSGRAGQRTGNTPILHSGRVNQSFTTPLKAALIVPFEHDPHSCYLLSVTVYEAV